jgi:hypothetical protein
MGAQRYLSSTSNGSWRAGRCSPPKAWRPSPSSATSPICRPPGDQGRSALWGSAALIPWGPEHHPWLHRTLQLTTHPRSDERLDKSIAPVHRSKAIFICTSGMRLVIPHCSPFDQGIRASGFTPHIGTRPENCQQNRENPQRVVSFHPFLSIYAVPCQIITIKEKKYLFRG